MIVQRLRGWNVGVERGQDVRQGEDGMPESVESLWRLVFSEAVPPTGNTIIFEMNEETKEKLVTMLKAGIVTASEIPRF